MKRFAKQAKDFYNKKEDFVKAEMFTYTRLKKTVDTPTTPKKGTPPGPTTGTV